MIVSMPIQRLRVAALVAATLCVITGCSSKRIPLTGTATLDGVPIEQGVIALLPEGDDPEMVVASAPIERGKFAFSDKNGPNRGSYRVEIRWQKETGKTTRLPTGDLVPELADVVPSRYNSQTTLRIDVNNDGKPAVFDLTTR
jgi:hypothetical protein